MSGSGQGDRPATSRFAAMLPVSVRTFWNKRNDFEKVVVFLAAFAAAGIALTYAWTPGWWFALHENWAWTYVACSTFLFLFIFFRLADRSEGARHTMEGVAAFFACITLLTAGYWYYYERPGVPKLDVGTSIEAWPIGGGMAMVRVDVSLTNVGTTVIDFREYRHTGEETRNGRARDDRIKVDLGQVLPFVEEYTGHEELLADFVRDDAAENREYLLERSYRWPPIARDYRLPEGEIEAGETEHYYYKAIVPCSEGMILASTVRMPKVGSLAPVRDGVRNESLVWLAQSLGQPVNGCS